MLHVGTGEIGSDKLAHAYAITAHRSQGSTVDVTHALEDGGGRELAYVAMSRARGASHIHLVAPLSQAASRLAWAWGDSAVSPGPLATTRRGPLSSSSLSACNCRAWYLQNSPTSSTMCAGKAMLWS